MFGSANKVKNKAVKYEPDYERDASTGQVHVLICCLDYKGTEDPLTATLDGDNIKALCRASGVSSLEVMYDNVCTCANISQRVEQMGSRMGENDYFIFFYAGHGTSVRDRDGDEADGKDEALCLVDENGEDDTMTDDTFAELLSSTIPEGVRIIILADCCHSGTIGDLQKECWEGREVLSISGCKDQQTSGDTGRGGIFTHSMLFALDKLARSGQEDFSVGLLYNATVKEDDAVFASEQDIVMECPPGFMPNQMAWPLIPKGSYVSPLRKAYANIVGDNEDDWDSGEEDDEDDEDDEDEDYSSDEEDEEDWDSDEDEDRPPKKSKKSKRTKQPKKPKKPNMPESLQTNPQLAQQLGIKPEVLQFMQKKGLGKMMGQKGDKYMESLETFSQKSGACNCSIQ